MQPADDVARGRQAAPDRAIRWARVQPAGDSVVGMRCARRRSMHTIADAQLARVIGGCRQQQQMPQPQQDPQQAPQQAPQDPGGAAMGGGGLSQLLSLLQSPGVQQILGGIGKLIGGGQGQQAPAQPQQQQA